MKLFLHHCMLFVCFLRCFARPRQFYLQKNDENLRRFLKSFPIGHNELFCPKNIDGTAVVTKNTNNDTRCGPEYDLCSDDSECEPGLMCCPSGCIYKCVVPQRPKIPIATDWIDEPEALTIGGNSWLIDDVESGGSRDMDCSTSVFPGIEPMLCLTGYKCNVQIEEDTRNQIPNKGVCVPDKSSESNIFGYLDFPSVMEKPKTNAPCIFNGKKVQHGYHDIIGCNSCFCKDGEVYCQVQPCLEETNKKSFGI